MFLDSLLSFCFCIGFFIFLADLAPSFTAYKWRTLFFNAQAYRNIWLIFSSININVDFIVVTCGKSLNCFTDMCNTLLRFILVNLSLAFHICRSDWSKV